MRHRRVWIAAATTVTVVLLFWRVLRNGDGDAPSPQFFFVGSDRDRFIAKAAQVEFATPIKYEPIRDLCRRRKFRPGLLFTCEWVTGGIGNVRNHVLNCVRYAIEGGGAIVVPGIVERNASDIADIYTQDREVFDYLLDRDDFVARLTAGCPTMSVYQRASDFPHYDKLRHEPLALKAGEDFEPSRPREGLAHPWLWREYLDRRLAEKDAAGFTTLDPLHVKLGRSYLEYPVYWDGEAFVEEFGKILSFRKDAKRLAAAALWKLQRRFRLPIDAKTMINPRAYYGAHLRLEEDAVQAWPTGDWRFARYEEQLAQQAANLARTDLNVVYVACGNQTVVRWFEQDIKAAMAQLGRDVTVVTKHELLEGAELAELEALTFDQQALVDFLLLLKASVFMGAGHSSFTWNVALRRHEVSASKELVNAASPLQESGLLRDEYSVIMGNASDYPVIDEYEHVMWP